MFFLRKTAANTLYRAAEGLMLVFAVLKFTLPFLVLAVFVGCCCLRMDLRNAEIFENWL